MSRTYDSSEVLVKTEHEQLAPYSVPLAHPNHVTVLVVVMTILWAAAVAVLIWLAVDLNHENRFSCSWADQYDAGDYVRFAGRAAEPYCGQPQRIMSDVTAVSTCQDACTDDLQCRFFTHDRTHSNCYLYYQGVLPDQNALAAVPGPTSLQADVYVKNLYRYVELLGALKDGQ